MQRYLWIAVGGALGSIARFWVGNAVGGRMGTRFPWGTFLVNISACAVIGFVITWMGRRTELNPAWRYLIPIGFIGAYSTFSTYEWELLTTLEAGEAIRAAIYAVSSLLLGLIAVWCGARIAAAIS